MAAIEFPEVTQQQDDKETLLNEILASLKMGAIRGIDYTNTASLTLGLYGGPWFSAGSVSLLDSVTKTLAPSASNYVEMTPAGVVSVNQSGFTGGAVIALYLVTTNASGITAVSDYRTPFMQGGDLAVSTLTITTGLSLPAGSVGAPSLYFGGDTTTGFYRPAANQLATTISGTQRGLWNSTGLTITGALSISTTLGVTGNTTLTGDLAVNGGDITSTSATFNIGVAGAPTSIRIGPAACTQGFGTTPVPRIHFIFGGAFTSGGGAANMVGLNNGSALTAITGCTDYIAQFRNSGTVVTQNLAQTIGVVTSVYLEEPDITKGTDTVTLASTLYILNAPTEGTTNAALYINSGAFLTNGVIGASAGAVGAPSIYFGSDTTTGHYRSASNTIGIAVSGALIGTWGSTGLIVGSMGSVPVNGVDFGLQVNATSAAGSAISAVRFNTATGSGFIAIGKSKNTSGFASAVVNNDNLGILAFAGSDTAQLGYGSRVRSLATGTWTTTSYPSKILLETCSSGSNVLTERVSVGDSVDVTGTFSTTGRTGFGAAVSANHWVSIGAPALADRAISAVLAGGVSGGEWAAAVFDGADNTGGSNITTVLFPFSSIAASAAGGIGAYRVNTTATDLMFYVTNTDARVELIRLGGVALTITLADAANFVFNATTGTKFGTATSQKMGWWNATPIVQPTTSVAAATFTANAGTAVNDASTFDGYTLGKVVKALRNEGLLA